MRSNQYLAVSPALYDVPQAMIVTLEGRPRRTAYRAGAPCRWSVDQGVQRVADHRRLLEDLLLHEVPVIALADQRAGDRRVVHRRSTLAPSWSKMLTVRAVITAQSPSSR